MLSKRIIEVCYIDGTLQQLFQTVVTAIPNSALQHPSTAKATGKKENELLSSGTAALAKCTVQLPLVNEPQCRAVCCSLPF